MEDCVTSFEDWIWYIFGLTWPEHVIEVVIQERKIVIISFSWILVIKIVELDQVDSGINRQNPLKKDHCHWENF